MVFKRYEKKYIIDGTMYAFLIPYMMKYMQKDTYSNYSICNVYLDTARFDLIKTSLEKPAYKEKLRLRGYGVPNRDSLVYLELKKKCKGIVYKRRVSMTLSEADQYLYRSKYPKERDCQILRELDYSLNKYRPIPQVYLSYDRISLIGKADPNLRITFDSNIQARNDDLYLEHGSYGTRILDPQKFIMEIKIPESMPIWLASLLSELKIFPSTFSKYGTYYSTVLAPAENGIRGNVPSTVSNKEIASLIRKGGVYCA